ncbi:hypothetical protein D3C72_2210010 [compost metagenome]
MHDPEEPHYPKAGTGHQQHGAAEAPGVQENKGSCDEDRQREVAHHIVESIDQVPDELRKADNMNAKAAVLL